MKRYLLEVDDKATAELNEKSFTLNGKPAFGLRVLANEISMEVLPTDVPLTQEDLTKAQEKGQKEAWELARKIANPPAAGGFDVKEMDSIFGTHYVAPILRNHTYDEAIQKIQAWEEEKKAVHVGDIVTLEWGGITHRAVVTRTTVNWLSVMFDDGNVDDVGISRCKKTGEHVNLEDITNKLKEEK